MRGGYVRQTDRRDVDRLRRVMDLSFLGPSGLSALGWDQRRCSPSLCSPCHRYTSPHYCRSTREKDENQVQKLLKEGEEQVNIKTTKQQEVWICRLKTSMSPGFTYKSPYLMFTEKLRKLFLPRGQNRCVQSWIPNRC